MSKRIRTLTNTAARKKSAEELLELLTEIFIEVESRPPNMEEASGLEQAVEWLKEPGNLLTWSMAEGGLRDRTWNVEGGPRDLFGDM